MKLAVLSFFVALAFVPDARAEATGGIPRLGDQTAHGDRPVLDSNSLRFLTSGDFPPFNFMDPGGRLVGYNVDLAEAICRVTATTCTIQMRPFEDLVPALTQKRGDAIIAGLDMVPTLRKQLAGTQAYLGMPGRFVARADAKLTATPEGLDKLWISAVAGTSHEAFLLDHFPGARIVAYPNETAARDALREGTVSAHFGDALGLSFWLAGEASRGCCAFLGAPYHERAYFGDGLRIAVPRGNVKLRRAMDWAIDKLGEDGTLAELYLRWFPNGYY